LLAPDSIDLRRGWLFNRGMATDGTLPPDPLAASKPNAPGQPTAPGSSSSVATPTGSPTAAAIPSIPVSAADSGSVAVEPPAIAASEAKAVFAVDLYQTLPATAPVDFTPPPETTGVRVISTRVTLAVEDVATAPSTRADAAAAQGPKPEFRTVAAGEPGGTAFQTAAAPDVPGGQGVGASNATVYLLANDGAAKAPVDATTRPARRNGVMHDPKDQATSSHPDGPPRPISGSASFAVRAAPAAHLRIGIIANTAAGAAAALTLTALDRFGNVATDYAGTVHFASSDAAALLPGDYTFTPGDQGVHNFAESVILKSAGPQTVTAADSATAGIAGTAAVAVSAGPPAHFGARAPSTCTAGVPFALTLTVLDEFGNPVAGHNGTVRFASSDEAAQLTPPYPYNGDEQGVHTFPDLILKTAGDRTITIADPAQSELTARVMITVAPGPGIRLRLDLPAGATAGKPCGLTVTVLDAFGNVAAGHHGTLHFTSSDPQANLPGAFTFGAADQGTHVFAAAVTFKTAGGQTLMATDPANKALHASAALVVQPAPATHFRLSAPDGRRAGTAFPVTITALDSFGHVAVGYRGTIHFASSDPNAELPPDYAFKAADQGVHTFPVALNTAGNQTLSVTDTVTHSITGSTLERSKSPPVAAPPNPSNGHAPAAKEAAVPVPAPVGADGRTAAESSKPPPSPPAAPSVTFHGLHPSLLDNLFAEDPAPPPGSLRRSAPA
jgi:hypothetical protein